MCAVPERCDARKNSGDEKLVLGQKLETKDVVASVTTSYTCKVVLRTLYIFLFNEKKTTNQMSEHKLILVLLQMSARTFAPVWVQSGK